jgi:surface polysaccharide O-acyltransferase-like enzyme
MGVPLFVMLSGALLLQPSKVNESIRVFLKKRLSRIGIAFVFWSVIYFAWSSYIGHQVLTVSYVIQTMLNGGAYYQFWFIYLIMGLYLITPVLRAVVAYADRKILRYLIILWFISASLIPLFHLITGFAVNDYLFLFGGFIGYFILGMYLIGVQVKTWILRLLLVGGILWTIIGLMLMSYPFHSLGQYYFFSFTTSVNIVVASIAVFMLLNKYPIDWPGSSHPKFKRLIQAISANTLPIFFLHVIIIETLNKGLLGFSISLMQINPFIEIPLGAVVTLFVTLGLILLMKKVPVLKTLIG